MLDQLETVWEDLVASILAVNQYSLERTYASVQSLRRKGLIRPENLAQRSVGEIVRRLKRGDCDRGKFTTDLFAKRLSSLGKYIASAWIVECEHVLAAGTVDTVSRLLTPVNGVWPKVLSNYFLLRAR